jgi:hypothetical protein
MPAWRHKRAWLLYLYGGQNISGCLFALAGLGLFFTGYITDGWFPIVIGLYAAGWLLMWRGKSAIDISFGDEVSTEDMLHCIDELIRASKSRLPAEGLDHLRKIRQTIADVMPRLLSDPALSACVVALKNAVTRDLPGTINNYLRLPAVFASLHVVDKGKTCRQLLLEQLSLLHGQLQKTVESIYRNDAEALIVNGLFLEEKSRPVKFIVDQ